MALNRRIAYVDLSAGTVEVRDVPLELRRKYLGGRGMDAYLLYNHIEPGTDPLGPDNALVLSAGLLSGTPAPAGARCQISAKSPLTGLLGSANMGGFFGPELRYAGFDHIVIQGRAEKPVYLWVHNGSVEIRAADHLWGSDAVQTQTRLREELGDPDVKVACIGVAGENRVRFACVRTGIKNAAGRTGMGAVMGSKNLKAVAVRGTLPIRLADPEGALGYLEELVDYIQSSKYAEIMGKWGTLFIFDVTNSTGLIRTRNFQSNQMPHSEDLECEAMDRYTMGMAACFGCTMHCRHKYVLPEGRFRGQYGEGPEYTSQGAFGTEVGAASMLGVLEANQLVNLHGLDTLEVGSMIGWAMELHEKGLLPAELVGDLDLRWGNLDAVIRLIDDIAHRRGLGDVLAEGPKGAIERLGPETAYYNIHVKGMSNLHSDERPTPSLALNIATSTRGADHLRSRPAIDLYHLPPKVLERIYGKPGLSDDYRGYEGKPWMVVWQERLYALVNALGVCKFQSVFLSPNMPKAEEYARVLRLVTGLEFTPEELMEIGERITTLERLFNLREGATRADDDLPERYFTEPTPEGLPAVRGKSIDRDRFDAMLDEYYDIHGWDREGRPTDATLARLGLDAEPTRLV
ncbi:MAG: aldehyde ferredoxin oxidoreductase family protein [Deltaproteobacteria bacterium]|nr:aldehyde ferredoxin oxidoreductase family protein [Deltaproteobacteria bacterium]